MTSTSSFSPEAPHKQDWAMIFWVLLAGTVTLSTLLFMPVFVGVMIDSYGFSEEQAGTLAAIDMLGIAFVSLFSSLWIKRFCWRSMIRLAATTLIACNLLTYITADYNLMCLLRFVAGCSAGIIAVLVMSVVSYLRDPDRIMAFYIITQVVIQSIGFSSLPFILEASGETAFFGFCAVLAVVALIGSFKFPQLTDFSPADADSPLENADAKSQLNLKPIMLSVGIIIFFIAQFSFFSFVERLGTEQGFSAQQIGSAFTISILIALLGPGTGALIGTRFGRFTPLLIAGLGELLACYGLSGDVSITAYIAYLSIFQLFWTMAIGFQVGLLVDEDKSRRFVLFLPLLQILGVAAGPALGGMAMGSGGFSAVAMLSGVALVIYMVLMLPVAFANERA